MPIQFTFALSFLPADQMPVFDLVLQLAGDSSYGVLASTAALLERRAD
jgi:hypothetical protein